MADQYSIFDPQVGLDQYLRKTSSVLSDSQLSALGSGLTTEEVGSTDSLGNPLTDSVSTALIEDGELASIVGYGKKTFTDTAAGYLMGLDRDGIYKWIIGNNTSSVDWAVTTAATLTVKGTITATSGYIGGWAITASALTSGTGSNTVSLDSGGSNPAIYAGSSTPGAAPFRVYQTGAFVATSATITGSITATSGTIGGWSINATNLISGSGANTVGLDSSGLNPAIYAGSATPGSAPFQVSQAGAITASSGTIGGFTITASTLYGSTIKTAATVGVGSNGVIMDTAGLRGYSATLGLVFNLPTDGSAPTFASGIINSTIFNVNTNAIIRTSETVGDGSVDSAGILVNNTGLYACQSSQLLVDANVKILIDGSASFKGAITAETGYIGGSLSGWVITTGKIYGGSGSAFSGLIQGTGTTKAFFAGATDNSGTAAKFYVTAAGDLYAASATLGGYKQYDAIATKDGVGGTTLVYYNGQTYNSIKETLDAAELITTKITIFVRNGTYDELKNCLNITVDGYDLAVTLIGENKNTTIIDFSSTLNNWGWKFDEDLVLDNLTIIGKEAYGPVGHADTVAPYVSITNCILKNLNTTATGSLYVYYDYESGSGSEYRFENNSFYCECPTINSSISACINLRGTSSNVTIRGNYFQCSVGAVYFNSGTSSNIVISENTVARVGHATNTLPASFYLPNDAYDSRVDNNKSYLYNGTGKYGYGVYWTGSSTTVTRRKIINNTISGADVGIYGAGGALNIQNNTVSDCASDGIQAAGGAWNTNDALTISNNVISNCTTTDKGGIKLFNSNFSVTGNIIFNCYNAVYDSDSRKGNIIVSNNYIRKCTYGINIRAYSSNFGGDGFVYSGNLIMGDASAYGTHAIVLGSYMNEMTITGNTIKYYTYGIVSNPRATSGGTWITITGNIADQITTASVDFVSFTGAPSEVILCNNIFGSKCYFGASARHIVNNRFSGSVVVTQGPQTLIGNRFMAGSDHAFEVTAGWGSAQINGNYFEASTAGKSPMYINDATSSYNLRFENNRFYQSSSTGGPTIYKNGDFEECSFVGNEFYQYNINSHCLQVVGSFDRTTGTHFIGSVISANTFRAGSNSHAAHLIQISADCSDATISGNRFYAGNNATTRYAVNVGGNAQYTIFNSNRVANGVPAGTSDGFKINGTNTGCSFTGNLRT